MTTTQSNPVATRVPRARAYGAALADLDVDFGRADRASAATAVLAACVHDAQHADAIWDWTVAERLQGLLAVRLAGQQASMDIHAVCGHCGEPMEITLDLRDFQRPPPPAQFDWTAGDGRALRLRLPRGRDLRDWSARTPSRREMLGALVENADDTALDDAACVALEAAYEAHDPLTDLQLDTHCPACAAHNRVDCDLESLLLAGFAQRQAQLLDEVVRLAGAFHWREADILALPDWRRAHYLRQLDGGAWM